MDITGDLRERIQSSTTKAAAANFGIDETPPSKWTIAAINGALEPDEDAVFESEETRALEKLQREVAALRAALEPFAWAAIATNASGYEGLRLSGRMDPLPLTVADLQRAWKVLHQS